MNLVDSLIAYETGTLSDIDTFTLFKDLVESGLAWKLQGNYGRVADYLIEHNIIGSGA